MFSAGMFTEVEWICMEPVRIEETTYGTQELNSQLFMNSLSPYSKECISHEGLLFSTIISELITKNTSLEIERSGAPEL
jgi:hypothetical protein